MLRADIKLESNFLIKDYNDVRKESVCRYQSLEFSVIGPGETCAYIILSVNDSIGTKSLCSYSYMFSVCWVCTALTKVTTNYIHF